MLRFGLHFSRISFALIAMGALAACTPQNTANTGFLTYEPEAGYEWAEPTGWSYAVVWKAGKAHPRFAHVFASETPGTWVPGLGYDWVAPQAGDLRAVWKPGLRYESLPHIAAGAKEDTWAADPGYTFKSKDSLQVAWQPGQAHSSKSHFIAAAAEGVWDVEPGYAKSVPLIAGTEYAYWSPGSAHPTYANIYAAAEEGYWSAAPGYRFASADSLYAEPIPFDTPAPVDGSTRFANFLGGLVKAAIGARFSEAQPDDGLVATGLGRPVARAIRDDGISDMADALSGR